MPFQIIEVNNPGPQGPAGPPGPVNTGSFATTGSNTFIGNQKILGSLTITGSTNGDYGSISTVFFDSGSSVVTAGPNIDMVAGPNGWSELGSNNGQNYVWVDDELIRFASNWNVDAHVWTIDLSGSMNAAGNINMNGYSITGSFNVSGSIVLTSPNGTKYALGVDNSGSLITTPV